MRLRNVLIATTTLVAGTMIGAATQQFASADISSGDRPVLVPIETCRIADTRPAPDNVGPKSSPLAAADTMTVSAQQAGTDCTGKIPAGATALSMNVTALNATSNSFLTIWPDGTRPDASALNPAPGQRVFNAVTTELAADQTFQIYNNRGDVDVFVDINGYYENHNHDDLYYTETEVDDALTAVNDALDALDVPRDLTLDGRVLTPTVPGTELIDVAAGAKPLDEGGCVGYDSRNTSVFGSLTMPIGATLNGFTATWFDAATADVSIRLWKRSLSVAGGDLQGLETVTSSGDGGLGSTTSAAMTEVVDPGEQFVVSFIFPTVTEDADLGALCGLELHLS